jgi:hypothetical protein
MGKKEEFQTDAGCWGKLKRMKSLWEIKVL